METHKRIVIEKLDGTHLEECIMTVDEAEEISDLIHMISIR